jgi:hypothetical protein
MIDLEPVMGAVEDGVRPSRDRPDLYLGIFEEYA